MSYRTYINGHEWLGNNESPKVILDELKRQGCPFNADWCTMVVSGDVCSIEGFEVKDLNALVKATEDAVFKKIKNNPNIAHFDESVEIWHERGTLTYDLLNFREYAYIFWSTMLLDFVGKEHYTMRWDDEGKPVYALKPGAKCVFKAY